MELTNTQSEYTIGIVDTENDCEVYRPIIMWNLKIESYISEKDLPYPAYCCTVKVRGSRGEIESFKVYIKDADFHKFEKVRSAIVAQTHGHLILNSRFDTVMWSNFVPKLLIDSADNILYQRPARNIGIQWHYLRSMSFAYEGVLQLEHVEVVYKDVVYNGLGEIKEHPVNVLFPEAFPNKTFRVSEFKPSGLRGYLRMFLPPYTSTSMYRREQQILVLIGATGNLFIFG